MFALRRGHHHTCCQCCSKTPEWASFVAVSNQTKSTKSSMSLLCCCLYNLSPWTDDKNPSLLQSKTVSLRSHPGRAANQFADPFLTISLINTSVLVLYGYIHLMRFMCRGLLGCENVKWPLTQSIVQDSACLAVTVTQLIEAPCFQSTSMITEQHWVLITNKEEIKSVKGGDLWTFAEY